MVLSHVPAKVLKIHHARGVCCAIASSMNVVIPLTGPALFSAVWNAESSSCGSSSSSSTREFMSSFVSDDLLDAWSLHVSILYSMQNQTICQHTCVFLFLEPFNPV